MVVNATTRSCETIMWLCDLWCGQHSRGHLYGKTLIRAATIACDVIHDEMIIDEINGLVVRNDRIDHAVGGHDDNVIAWLLSFWMLIYSRNLDVYGITHPLKDVREWKKGAVKKELTDREIYEENQRKKIRKEFDDYMEKLKNTDCPYTCSALENILRRLFDRIADDMDQVGSFDDLIKAAKNRDRERINGWRQSED